MPNVSDFVERYINENERPYRVLYDPKETNGNKLLALKEIINADNLVLSWVEYKETFQKEHPSQVIKEDKKEEELELPLALKALEQICQRFLFDSNLKPHTKSIVALLLAAQVTQFLPQPTGTPLSDPTMQLAICCYENVLNNPLYRPQDRIFAAQWLVDRHLRRLPREASMSHEYAKNAFFYVDRIYKDDSIPTDMLESFANRLTKQYEVRFKKESNRESKKEVTTLPKSHNPSSSLDVGLWKSKKFKLLETLKKKLCSDEEHLQWSLPLSDLLELVNRSNPQAQTVLREVVDYHFKAAYAQIDKMVAALKSNEINEISLEKNIRYYADGNSYIELEREYQKLGCSHLRQLYYLATESDGNGHKSYDVAKDALSKFYQKMGEECDKAGIKNGFQEKADFYFYPKEAASLRYLKIG